MSYDPKAPNKVVLSLTEEQVTEAFSRWTQEMQDSALSEGWDLWDSEGSVAGPIQVQHIDCPEDYLPRVVTLLDDDDDAMVIVMRGTGAHHVTAREIVKEFNPEDYARMVYVESLR